MSTITIYTGEGHTYQFNNVTNIRKINKDVCFEYEGIILGKITEAIFHNIVGMTVTEGGK